MDRSNRRAGDSYCGCHRRLATAADGACCRRRNVPHPAHGSGRNRRLRSPSGAERGVGTRVDFRFGGQRRASRRAGSERLGCRLERGSGPFGRRRCGGWQHAGLLRLAVDRGPVCDAGGPRREGCTGRVGIVRCGRGASGDRQHRRYERRPAHPPVQGTCDGNLPCTGHRRGGDIVCAGGHAGRRFRDRTERGR